MDLGDVHFLHLTDGAEYYDITFVDRYVSSLKPTLVRYVNTEYEKNRQIK